MKLPVPLRLGNVRPCGTCGAKIAMAFDAGRKRWEPIEVPSGRNHFKNCPDAKDFGKPGAHMLDYCFTHETLYRGAGCYYCAEEDKSQRTLEKF